MQLSTQAWKTN